MNALLTPNGLVSRLLVSCTIAKPKGNRLRILAQEIAMSFDVPVPEPGDLMRIELPQEQFGNAALVLADFNRWSIIVDDNADDEYRWKQLRAVRAALNHWAQQKMFCGLWHIKMDFGDSSEEHDPEILNYDHVHQGTMQQAFATCSMLN